MKLEHTAVQPVDGREKLPLPGNYPCLTMQLNVTLHPTQNTAKFVLIVREPSEQYEIARAHCQPGEWLPTREAVETALKGALDDMHYLGAMWTHTR